jgi:hypothetical protein
MNLHTSRISVKSDDLSATARQVRSPILNPANSTPTSSTNTVNAINSSMSVKPRH